MSAVIRIAKSPWMRSIIAATLAVAAGIASRELVDLLFGLRATYLPFVLWIVLAGLLEGGVAGFLAIAGFVIISCKSLQPTGLVITRTPQEGLALFIATSVVLAGLASWAHATRRRASHARSLLKQSEERLRTALDAGGMGTWEWIIATNKVEWSAGLEAIHGKARGTFKGTFDDALSNVHPEDRQKLIDAVQSALAECSEYSIEYRIQRFDGQERWLEARGRVLCDEANKPLRMIGVCMDISARKKSEAALAGRERQMRLVTDALPALISYVDRAERYIFASHAYEQWLCRPIDQILGKTVRQLASSDEVYAMIRPHIDAVLAGQPTKFSTTARYPDGVTRDVDVTYSPDVADGRVNGFAVLVTDVTERRRNELALMEANRQFTVLTETVPDFVWSCAGDGSVQYLNGRYIDYTGVTLETVNNGGWHSAVHPEDWAAIEKAWSVSLRDGTPFELEYRFRHKRDGQYRWFLTRTVPVHDDAGAVTRWVGAATDIHDSKMAREERERLLAAERIAREDAERAGRTKDEFLAVLSHELRTPLAPVLMTVSLMESHPDLPDSMREDVAMIRRNVQLEARLIDDLLDLTRLARGKIRYDFQPVDLHVLIRSAISICCNDAKHEVTTQLDATESTVNGDTARLQQVFWNLLNNAWKFTPPGGKVTVSTRCSDGRIIASVADTGAGIDPDVLPRIFDAFEQGDAIRARKFGGLGLGLAICKALVTAHGGGITARSEGKNRGASFIVELPTIAAPAPSPVPDSPEKTKHSNGNGRLRLLLVEDHPHTLRALTRLLNSMGHAVDGATTIAGGLELAATSQYDLLISDLGLPDGSGFDLMRQLRQQYGIRGIALSGFGMEDDVERSREAGFIEHLVKPVDFQCLRETIWRVVQSE